MWSNIGLFAMGLLAVAFGVSGLVELASGETSRSALLAVAVGVAGVLALIAVAYSVIQAARERRGAEDRRG